MGPLVISMEQTHIMKLIDSHIHFWDPAHLRYKWLDDLDTINKPHLPASLPRSGEGWEMDKLVFVQADCLPEQGLNEVDWVAELAKDDDRIAGIVAFAPLANHNFHAYLTRLTETALVRGVRRLIQGEEQGFALQEHFVDAVQVLPDYNLSFDICVLHPQLADIVALVRQCPNVSFVLDHLGKPGIKSGEIDIWREDIQALATFDNVTCKISGLVTEADLENWDVAGLQPYVDVVLEAFGPSRLMYGGDYPVMKLANTDYVGWVETALALLVNLSESEKQQVFHDNAKAFYRL